MRGQPQRDGGRILGTMCTCEDIEKGTHAYRASKLGLVDRKWTQNCKLGIPIQETPPSVWKTDTFIVFYLFVLHSVTCLKLATLLLVLAINSILIINASHSSSTVNNTLSKFSGGITAEFTGLNVMLVNQDRLLMLVNQASR